MARAIAARRQGDNFQARLFWLHATGLLDPASPITKVAYETGPRAFDDIQVEYDKEAAPLDHEGQPFFRRHIQCKWHTTGGVYGFSDLTDPAFINASTVSLLQRAHEAQRIHAPDGLGCRIELITNWRIREDDPLFKLIGKNSDALRLDRLFQGKTTRSQMGKVRALWREHLGVDDEALKLVARVLSVAEVTDSLMALRERLDDRFAVVGLRRIPASESSFVYDDLVAKLLEQGRIEFDRETFRKMARSEGILDGPPLRENVPAIGIRSFMHPIDNLENRCDRMLNLVPYFDGRYIRDTEDWDRRVHPDLCKFVLDAAQASDQLRVILDTHVSLAFAVGALLNVKSGRRVDIEQRTGGRRFWSVDDGTPQSSWPGLVLEHVQLAEDRDEVAVTVSLTHDVARDAGAFVARRLPQVGDVLHCRPEGGPSQGSVRCGRHAWQLAETLVRSLSELRANRQRFVRVHFFLAGPNGFAFFLGQHQQTIGTACIYEWDFEGLRDGTYSLGLCV